MTRKDHGNSFWNNSLSSTASLVVRTAIYWAETSPHTFKVLSQIKSYWKDTIANTIIDTRDEEVYQGILHCLIPKSMFSFSLGYVTFSEAMHKILEWKQSVSEQWSGQYLFSEFLSLPSDHSTSAYISFN